jgi:predicted transcriptional regulator
VIYLTGDGLKIVDPYDILKILYIYNALAGSVSLSTIAKELGVRKQSVHKHMKKLAEKGFVVKGEKGHYTLTEKGRRFVEDVSSMEKKLDNMLRGFHKLWEIGEYNILKDGKLRKGALYIAIAGVLGYFLANIAKISRRINEKMREKDLDKFLGSREFREEVLKTLLDLLLISGEDGWETIETFSNYIISVALFNITTIKATKIALEKEKVHKSLREIYKNNSHVS